MDYKTLCETVAASTGQSAGVVRKVLNASFENISGALESADMVSMGANGRFRKRSAENGQTRILFVSGGEKAGGDAS